MLFPLPGHPLRSRLAPTPSGLLHPGNGLSFVMTWALVRATGGHLLLRIDDLDRERCRDEYIEDIFRTLDWLGIDYDEGPQDVANFHQHWSQHLRLDAYYAALEALRGAGQLFACRCTRRDVLAVSPEGRYPGTCGALNLPFDLPDVAWRVQPATAPWRMCTLDAPFVRTGLFGGDAFVVRQKNGLPAYQIASLVDDTHFGIDTIVRGQDLWESTESQLYLAQLLDLASFSETCFWHHPLVLDDLGQKLSKSKGAGSLRAWREAGRAPADLFVRAAAVLQLSERVTSATELVAAMRARS